MNEPFALGRMAAMVLEAGAAAKVGDQVSDLMGGPARVLLVADPALEALGIVERIRAPMIAAGHDVQAFDDLTSDPKEAAVDGVVAQGRGMKADCVVALGGGAALDVGKLAAALMEGGDACAAYRLGAKPLPFRRTGLICVPTTAGTGSEMTATSIVSTPEGVKNWFNGPGLRADVALMDPELMVGLPAFWSFTTGMDALVHAIESRTNRYRFPQNDATAERAIVLVRDNIERAVTAPDDLDARSAMLLAAALAGAAISNTGCAVAHNMGHAMGSLAGIPHGRAVTLALLSSLDWAVEGNREAFDRVGELLGGTDSSAIRPWFEQMAAACGQQLTLTDEERAQLDAEALATAMAEPANIAMMDSNARRPAIEDWRSLAESLVA